MTNEGAKLDLEQCTKTSVAMTSLADEILFIADTWTKRLVEIRVDKLILSSSVTWERS